MYSKFHILIVEDDPFSALLMKEYLRKLNVKISEVRNGMAAIEFCKIQKVDLVITDILMPVMNGLDELKELRIICPDTRVIAETAYATRKKIDEIKQAGFDSIIIKPYQREIFLSLVKTQLDKKKAFA